MADVNPSVEKFLSAVSSHEMQIILDDGCHRHLKFSKKHSSDCHFHITTWPGYLCFSGDMGCFVFSRLKDMFEFHRAEHSFQIDFRYWAEKVEAGETTQFSRQSLQNTISELYKEWDSPEIIVGIDHYLSRADDNHDRYSAGELLDEFCSDCGRDEYETWEYEFKEYTYCFIWACYAIRYAISKYDLAKKAVSGLADGVARELTNG